MFFDRDELTVRILDVVALDQGQTDTLNQRGYHALSFRLDADTRLSFRDQTIHAGSGSIGYFPANLSYCRQSVRDRMIVIHFDTDNYFSGSIELLNIIDPEPIRLLFEKAYEAWSDKKAGYYYETTACFYSILALVRQRTFKALNDEIPKQIQPSFNLINEHFTDPKYFSVVFRKTVGCSPQRLLISLGRKWQINIKPAEVKISLLPVSIIGTSIMPCNGKGRLQSRAQPGFFY